MFNTANTGNMHSNSIATKVYWSSQPPASSHSGTVYLRCNDYTLEQIKSTLQLKFQLLTPILMRKITTL